MRGRLTVLVYLWGALENYYCINRADFEFLQMMNTSAQKGVSPVTVDCVLVGLSLQNYNTQFVIPIHLATNCTLDTNKF